MIKSKNDKLSDSDLFKINWELSKLTRFFQSDRVKQFQKHAFTDGGIPNDLVLILLAYPDNVREAAKVVFGVNDEIIDKAYQLASYNPELCNGCYSMDKVMKWKCSKCGLAYYCSDYCLANGWEYHEPYCKHRRRLGLMS